MTDLESRLSALLAQAGAVTPRECDELCGYYKLRHREGQDAHSVACNERHAARALARQARMVAAGIEATTQALRYDNWSDTISEGANSDEAALDAMERALRAEAAT